MLYCPKCYEESGNSYKLLVNSILNDGKQEVVSPDYIENDLSGYWWGVFKPTEASENIEIDALAHCTKCAWRWTPELVKYYSHKLGINKLNNK